MSIRIVLRPFCWLVGHQSAGTFLPEDEFGLYAYSRLWCPRCEFTFAERQP